MYKLSLLSLFLIPWCNEVTNKSSIPERPVSEKSFFSKVGEIPLPPGFQRISLSPSSFGAWLRDIHLKKDNRVFLYNGQLKKDQSVQFEVLDIPVGKKDLQQCADAVMRLRAEWLLQQNKADSISFLSTSGQSLSFAKWRRGWRYKLSGNKLELFNAGYKTIDERTAFESYLEFVFSYAGTLSLEKQLKPGVDIRQILPGDVLVKGGAPGHAMIVMDVAINADGERIFILAQGYMPAQDIHIVKNEAAINSLPWYDVTGRGKIYTPGWTFSTDQLYSW